MRPPRTFSKEEEKILRKHYKSQGADYVIQLIEETCGIKRSRRTIWNWASENKMKRQVRYTRSEERFIEENYGKISNQKIADKLNEMYHKKRTANGVKLFANSIGLTEKEVFAEEEGAMSISEAARYIGVSVSRMKQLISEMAIPHQKNTRFVLVWKKDIEPLREFYQKKKAPLPWRGLKREEAAALFSMDPKTFFKRVNQGEFLIQCCMTNGTYFYKEADVLLEMRKRGISRSIPKSAS